MPENSGLQILMEIIFNLEFYTYLDYHSRLKANQRHFRHIKTQTFTVKGIMKKKGNLKGRHEIGGEKQ